MMRRGGWYGIRNALIVLVVVVLTIKAATAVEWGRWPEMASLTVESGLNERVLVDVRLRTPSGQVEGPITQLLVPGSAVTFSASPDQPLCVRVITLGDRRVVSFQIEGSEHALTTAIRLPPSTLERPPADLAQCEPELARHRVRTARGQYFEPDRPERLRRERILSRDQL